MSNRDHCVYRAKLAEQAERYEEMAENMLKVAEYGDELSVEERNLLSVAYKNAVGSRRAAWRIIQSVMQKEQSRNNDQQAGYAREYCIKVEKELQKICDEIINVLGSTLVGKASNGESKVFYYKMKADYYRYIAEFQSDGAKRDAADCALREYQDAYRVAEKDLAVTHPIRLGLALNYSVFQYEVLNMPDEACKLARTAFEDAIAELDSVAEDSYKDSTLIMQLLRDNLTLWTSSDEDASNTGPSPPVSVTASSSPTEKVWWCFHPVRNTGGSFAGFPTMHWFIRVGTNFYENTNTGIQCLISETNPNNVPEVQRGCPYTVGSLTNGQFALQYGCSPGPKTNMELMYKVTGYTAKVIAETAKTLMPCRRPFGCYYLGTTTKTHREIMEAMERFAQGKIYKASASFFGGSANEANCHMLTRHLCDFCGCTGESVKKLHASPFEGHDVSLENYFDGNFCMFPCVDPTMDKYMDRWSGNGQPPTSLNNPEALMDKMRQEKKRHYAQFQSEKNPDSCRAQ